MHIEGDRDFVDREVEVNEFEASIAALIDGSDLPDGPRIFERVGIAGVGKSSLFAEFRKRAIERGIRTFAIDFALRRSDEPIDFFLLDTLVGAFSLTQAEQSQDYATVLSLLNGSLSERNAYPTDRAGLLSQLAKLLSTSKSVLLMDSAEHWNLEFPEWLFEHFLLQLVEGRNTLVFIASRRVLEWGKFTYRIKRRYLNLKRLDSFSVETTALHIQTAGGDPALASQIHKLSNGNGSATIHLLRAIAQLDARVDAKNFGDFERRLVNVLYNEYVEKLIQIPSDLYRAFQVTSVLRRLDIDLPNGFLQHIRAGEWLPADWRKLLDEMRSIPRDELVVANEDPEAGYFVAQPVRTILALRLRFDEPETYGALSKSAVEYYDQRFKNESRLGFVREKLYHLADLYRLMSSPRWDVEIARELQFALRQSIHAVLPELYAAGENQVPFQGSKAVRVEQIRRLQLSIRKDRELRDKLGDTAPSSDLENSPTIFDAVIDDIIRRAESPARYTLSIIKTTDSPLHTVSSSNYLVSLHQGERPVGAAEHVLFPGNLRKRLFEKLDEPQTASSLEALGKALFAQALPPNIQKFIQANDNPTVILTNDMSVPWDIIHDGRDFVCLKVELGKIPITGGSTRVPLLLPKSKVRVLLIGVSQPQIAGLSLARLESVAMEIQLLADLFSQSNRVDFNYDRDVLLDEMAFAWDFTEKINTGNYDIVHFAGHATTGIRQGETESDIAMKPGLALWDGIIAFDSMQQLLLNTSPFVFMNACKQEGRASDRTRYESAIEGGVGFLLGGAAGCVVTVSNIDDRAAPLFASEFYTFLLQARSVGESLRLAKRKVQNLHSEATSWASYVLLGYPDFRPLADQ